ncbi:MAG: hypothetical protein KatS3mg038_1541 [Candidatus Kapaibacterium sp.]|nr:MAG: hypothetical protein KatS3mg038_1541 [Candidatus Kapabacteria bacterium]
MKFVNLTPHAINIYNSEKQLVMTVPPSGAVARVQAQRKLSAVYDGIEIYRTQYGEIENLPPPEPDTIFIVSGLVAVAAKDRDDVLQPGELLRSDSGQPIGCVGLQKGG